MHLKRLELSGFKSFAKTTVLEFPSKITAIVGPNGSGKSNVAEAIRWVLGEQSMKSLRGKKGEDLIWNGSSQAPRMGKALVTLVFDNKDGAIPLAFDEVALARKIFRDGVNEYYLNNSQVRLRDIVELLARLGLGETKHNIIGQGDVDRMLLSSPRDRREMLEEALGLRVWQLKKNESERKLEHTESNMKQVEGLLREIAPHLKFLRAQAEKAQARESVARELRELELYYFAHEQKEVHHAKKRLEADRTPIITAQQNIWNQMRDNIAEIEQVEQKIAAEVESKSQEEKTFLAYEAQRREIERDLGRLEGKLEAARERASHPKIRVIDTRYIQDEIEEFLAEIKTLLDEEDQIETLRAHVMVLVEDMENLLIKISHGTVEEEQDEDDLSILRVLEQEIHDMQKTREQLLVSIRQNEEMRTQEHQEERSWQQKVRELDYLLRAKQDEERDLTVQLERFRFDEERIMAREHELKRGMKESGIEDTDVRAMALEHYTGVTGEELRRRIDRMRAKLEEIGGIDADVVREYQETETRHTFLSRELDDLKNAAVSLKELIRDLDRHVRDDFKNGFSKIKDEFHNYFRVIFGGGKASLHIIEKKEGVERGEAEDERSALQEGIEISVDLPRKRIRGLAMLSGGERALTSIALLFAITAVNPPPFLVLDETDAALDEANSQRFAAILRELAKKTQLILVTHNRETMKCASILYGVTMGDDGVSKLLSLQLDEAEAYTNR